MMTVTTFTRVRSCTATDLPTYLPTDRLTDRRGCVPAPAWWDRYSDWLLRLWWLMTVVLMTMVVMALRRTTVMEMPRPCSEGPRVSSDDRLPTSLSAVRSVLRGEVATARDHTTTRGTY